MFLILCVASGVAKRATTEPAESHNKKRRTKANSLMISFAGSAEGALAGEAPKNYIKIILTKNNSVHKKKL